MYYFAIVLITGMFLQFAGTTFASDSSQVIPPTNTRVIPAGTKVVLPSSKQAALPSSDETSDSSNVVPPNVNPVSPARVGYVLRAGYTNWNTDTQGQWSQQTETCQLNYYPFAMVNFSSTQNYTGSALIKSIVINYHLNGTQQGSTYYNLVVTDAFANPGGTYSKQQIWFTWMIVCFPNS